MAKKGKTLDGTIIDCMDGVLAEWFPGDTWMSWRSILKGAFAIPMTAEELDFFSQVAEREPPQQRVRELWVVGGRRGGKDSIASLIITYIAAMFDGKRRTIGGVTLPALRRGERGTIFCLARDRDQAAIALDYVKGFFVGNEAVPELRQMVVKEVRDGIQLANGVDIIVGTPRHPWPRRAVCRVGRSCLLQRRDFGNTRFRAVQFARARHEDLARPSHDHRHLFGAQKIRSALQQVSATLQQRRSQGAGGQSHIDAAQPDAAGRRNRGRDRRRS
jgi:hypothetical protein